MRIGCFPSTARHRPLLSGLLAGTFLVTVGRAALAHEGHAPLPTKGTKVLGDRLMLSASAAKAIDLTTAKIQLGDLQRTVIATATVEVPCHHHAYATTMVAGKVTSVLAQPGDTVDVGQELARIESIALETLQLAMLQASGELALADRLLNRREKTGSAVSGRTILETRAERDQKAAQFTVAWQKLRSLGLSWKELDHVRATGLPLPDLAITSPIAGIVSVADVRVGQIVEPTEHLYHIIDRSHVWAVAEVLESDSPLVRLGQPTQVRIDAAPDQTFVGHIEYLGLVVDSKKHTFPVRVTLDNGQDLLRPGMFGRMFVTVASASKSILCPAEALLEDAEGKFVLLEEGTGKYLRRPVELGLRTSEFSEVIDGLFPGDRVVTTGNHELAALFDSRPAANKRQELARTKNRPGSTSSTDLKSTKDGFLIAKSQIELPTDSKAFATTSIQGKILRILVERGQRVVAGDVLAEVESLELKTWQLDLLQTRVLLQLTKTALERMESLSANGAVPEKDIWQLRSRLQIYLHTEQSLVHKLRMVGLSDTDIQRIEKRDLNDPQAGEQINTVLPIRSPASGEIADFDLAIGQVVSPEQQVFAIHDTSRMWVKGHLFEQDAGRVRGGQEIEVQLVSNPECRATIPIIRTSPVMATAERAVSVWAELDNSAGQWKEGMLARMSVYVGGPSPNLAAEQSPEPASRFQK